MNISRTRGYSCWAKRDARISWYKERLRAKQERDMALWTRHIAALEAFVSGSGSRQFDVRSRLAEARAQMTRVSSVAYLAELVGTIGADPFTDGH